MYRQGQGIKKDEMQAQYWAKKAEEGKHSLSDNRQRVLINNGPILADPVPPKAMPRKINGINGVRKKE